MSCDVTLYTQIDGSTEIDRNRGELAYSSNDAIHPCGLQSLKTESKNSENLKPKTEAEIDMVEEMSHSTVSNPTFIV